jgi:hypothetical protein
MRIIEGNGHRFLEIEGTSPEFITYIPVDKIYKVQSDGTELFIHVENSVLRVVATPAEFFSLIGCHTLAASEPLPF